MAECNMCGEDPGPRAGCVNCGDAFPFQDPHPTHQCPECGLAAAHCDCDAGTVE